MNLHLLFALLAIVCFLLAAVGADQGKGMPVGLIFFVLLVAF
jgi:hypothetical protein